MMEKEKAIWVKNKIKEDFKDIDKQDLESFFEELKNNNRNYSFIGYYNRTVLDKEKIKFGEFKRQWGIQGMTKEVYDFFDKNYDKLKKEIVKKKNIEDFFRKYCSRERKEGSFCSKLFHTFLPSEFPPVDYHIRKRFNLLNEDFIKAVLIIKKGYGLFIRENPKPIEMIRKELSKEKFSFLRVDELSDIRILDMYYWLQGRLERMKK